MTDSTAQPTQPSTDLVATGGKLAAIPGQTIRGFLAGLSKADAKATERPEPVLPAPVVVTDDQRKALDALADATAALKWPTKRRALSAAEQTALVEYLVTVKEVDKLVTQAKESLRTALFNDLDVAAEQDGTADASTPRDGKGFYLLDATRPGYAREVRSGTPSADAQELAQLDVEGLIEHEDYLAATKQVRVVSEVGFLRLVARKPHLLPVLRRAVKLSRAASVSLKIK